MTATIKDILSRHNINLVLLDATGVLYNDRGVISGLPESIQEIQKSMPVFVVTNNSNNYVDDISSKLIASGIPIPEKNIISSGFGLSMDERIINLIKGKSVYVFGKPKSYPYVNLAKPKQILDSPEGAEIIIFTSTYREDNEQRKADAIAYLRQNPQVQLICSNPDQYVKSKVGDRFFVCGHAAKEVGDVVGKPVYYIGKPEQNFSWVVKKFLSEQGYTVGPQTLFCDDNPHNVARLQEDLGVVGAAVTETGIYDFIQEDEPGFEKPDYLIERFVL